MDKQHENALKLTTAMSGNLAWSCNMDVEWTSSIDMRAA
jgi:hypothetical protein